MLASLLALYFIWGSTYLAIRLALPGFPPLMMSGLRFVCAGGLFYVLLRMRGAPRPTRVQWFAALRVGTLLISGNALVVIAEQWVSSGVAAVAIASVPLWSVLFAGLWGRWPAKGEWIGLAIGLAGVALLQSGVARWCGGPVALRDHLVAGLDVEQAPSDSGGADGRCDGDAHGRSGAACRGAGAR